MTKVLVSFSTRPEHGSEGGVGWSFLKAAATLCAQEEQQLFVVCDARDELEIRARKADLVGSDQLKLIPVSVPQRLLDRYGDSRSRQTYLGWRRVAADAISELCRKQRDISVVHQVTFATGVLPSAIPKEITARKIWGPLSVPWAATHRQGQGAAFHERIGVRLARELGRKNVAGMDLVVATNEMSGHLFAKTAHEVEVEPNIVVDFAEFPVVQRDPELLTTAGLLSDLKRPWLAIQALKYPGLENYRLQVIGDGPLRGQLENYARQEGLSARVSFLGRVPHGEMLSLLAASRVLVHPSVREGASWVTGEAAAVGVPAVVFDNVGAATTVRLSDNGGAICSSVGDLAENLAAGVLEVCSRAEPGPSSRWSAERLPSLLKKWWAAA